MIERLVVWGGQKDLSSHRHIHRAYHHTAHKMGIKSYWATGMEDQNELLTPGTVCIAIDIDDEFLEFREGVKYVLHNFDGSHPICQQAKPENLLRMQVWTNDSTGVKWDKCRSFDLNARTVFFPWGTNLLVEEFMEPVFNHQANWATFVGAIWGEASPYGELGNVIAIAQLKNALAGVGLEFKHHTHIPDEANIREIRIGRLAPAVAGGWQVDHGYLPCRCFKNASYGQVMFTNVPAANELFGDATVPGSTIRELVENVLKLKQREYTELVYAQQRVAARYTYRENLQNINRAFEEMSG
jgi:hypothetical protein